MGMIARYFARLAAIVRPKRSVSAMVSADANGLIIGGERVAWGDVRRLHAFKRDIFIGDFLGMVMLDAGGRVFEIDEASPGWQEVGPAIERNLPESLPHAEWTLRLLAAGTGDSIAIYPSVRPRTE